MSLAKRMLEHSEQYKYSCNLEKYVCSDCVGDSYLKNYIKENAVENECSYCMRKSKSKNIALDLDTLMEVIMEGVFSEYTEALNCLPYDGEDDVYFGDYSDTDDFVDNYLAPEIDTGQDELIEDIKQCIEPTDWCEDDPFGTKAHKIDYDTWKRFSNHVKHNSRFMFYRIEEPENQNEENVYQNSFEILDEIGTYVNELNLIRDVKKPSFFRARKYKKYQRYPFKSAAEMGTPKKEDAKYSNRMSPAGIPMFYGAMDEKTALEEIRGSKNIKISVARFDTQKDLCILDLSKRVVIPSLFDPESRHLRQNAYFINDFIETISEPVNLDLYEHIEYIPTQVVTEFFRYILKTKKQKSIDGIFYKSSRCNGVCCCLFIQNEDCSDDYNDKSKVLFMDKSSIKEVTVPSI